METASARAYCQHANTALHRPRHPHGHFVQSKGSRVSKPHGGSAMHSIRCMAEKVTEEVKPAAPKTGPTLVSPRLPVQSSLLITELMPAIIPSVDFVCSALLHSILPCSGDGPLRRRCQPEQLQRQSRGPCFHRVARREGMVRDHQA